MHQPILIPTVSSTTGLVIQMWKVLLKARKSQDGCSSGLSSRSHTRLLSKRLEFMSDLKPNILCVVLVSKLDQSNPYG